MRAAAIRSLEEKEARKPDFEEFQEVVSVVRDGLRGG